MPMIIGVRFPSNTKTYFFDPKEVLYSVGDNVVVETAQGVEMGKVSRSNKMEEGFNAELKPALRKATEADMKKLDDIARKKEFAIKTIKEKVAKRELKMKILGCEYTFDAQKALFYFTAEGRIDFRELVKDLASILHVRIELRQVYERDDIKIRGAMSPCGRQCCCIGHLKEYEKVTIKMAKNQGLALAASKISGTCGKLMCCLKYENDYYAETIKKMPKRGSVVTTPDGIGIVEGDNILKQLVTVRLENDGGGVEVKEFPLEKVILSKGGMLAEEVGDASDEENALKNLE